MNCLLDVTEIPARTQEIARLLAPLAPPSRRIACARRFLNRQTVLTAHIGEEPSEPDPDQWRFPTRISGIRASYYEMWQPHQTDKNSFCLTRAYLHLYLRRERGEESQILALHCDPNEPPSARHYIYKAGPHVHMSAAEDPLDRAHIALNTANLKDILKSVGDLTSALRTAVTMVDDQVLTLY
jgi:hypothetical protein